MSLHRPPHFSLGFLFPKAIQVHHSPNCYLDEADVAVAPGNGFGEYGEGYIRVGLLEDEGRLEEAVKRIEKLNLFS